MRIRAIIPARYASTRFPGKPLAMLGSKSVIQWVCERAAEVFDNVVVATDDQRIADAVTVGIDTPADLEEARRIIKKL